MKRLIGIIALLMSTCAVAQQTPATAPVEATKAVDTRPVLWGPVREGMTLEELVAMWPERPKKMRGEVGFGFRKENSIWTRVTLPGVPSQLPGDCLIGVETFLDEQGKANRVEITGLPAFPCGGGAITRSLLDRYGAPMEQTTYMVEHIALFQVRPWKIVPWRKSRWQKDGMSIEMDIERDNQDGAFKLNYRRQGSGPTLVGF